MQRYIIAMVASNRRFENISLVCICAPQRVNKEQ
jgi:hypothetical protein